MQKKYKTFVVINPRSADGYTGKRINVLIDKLNKIGALEYELTKYKGHASEITSKALHEGYNRIIAIGGDGTFNEVVNGFFTNSEIINNNSVLGFISGGTGADFVRSLNIPSDIDKAIEIIINDRVKEIDVVQVISKDNNDNDLKRYFINVSNIGIGGEVVNRVNNSSKLLGGFITFLLSTATTVMYYKNKKITLIYDKSNFIEGVYSNIIVGNGKYCGGGMKFIPEAELDDSHLDILTIGDINKIEFFRNILKIYRGTHLNFSKIGFKKCKSLDVIAEEKIKVEVDGENCGFTPAHYTILPQVLNIIY